MEGNGRSKWKRREKRVIGKNEKWKELKENVENTASEGGRKGKRRDGTRKGKENKRSDFTIRPNLTTI